VGLLVAGLTLWTCYYFTVHRAETDTSPVTLWIITAFLALLALALTIYSLRLLMPFLRVDGGHIITLQGLAGFVVLYTGAMIAAMLSGNRTVAGVAPGMLVLFSTAVLIRERLRARRAE